MLDLNPLDIGRIVVSERRRIFGRVLEASYEKGVLRQLAELAENLGVIILHMHVSMPKPTAETAKAIAFLDLTGSEASPEQIEEILKEQEFVKFAKVISPSKHGFVSDTHYFPLLIRDERVLVFRKEVYAGIFEGVRSRFGSAGDTFLYYEGFEAGKRAT